jgi:6-phosphogluconolactonase
MLSRQCVFCGFAFLLLLVYSLLPATGKRTVFAQRTRTKDDFFVYVGTYTDTPARGEGIYGYRYDARTGHLTPLGVMARTANPSFLATDPRYRFLYAVTETGRDQDGSGPTAEDTVSSYSINHVTGQLTFLNQVSSAGKVPCHLAVDRTGRMLFVADYGSGRVVSYAIKPDGSIGPVSGSSQDSGSSVNPQRQEGPHVHATVLSPDNRFLFTPDLGIDQVKIFKIDLTRKAFTPNDPPSVSVNPGLGPRHFAFGHRAKFAYVICEMGSSVVAFSYDAAKGSLKPIQTISALPSDFKGESTSAEIEIDTSGRFLYASNRGNDSIAVFSIDQHNGTLTRLQVAPTLGKCPRNFKIAPAGNFLAVANQTSNQLVLLKVDHNSGQLTPSGKTVDVPAPVCVIFVPAE